MIQNEKETKENENCFEKDLQPSHLCIFTTSYEMARTGECWSYSKYWKMPIAILKKVFSKAKKQAKAFSV